jgi:hypothetical protein
MKNKLPTNHNAGRFKAPEALPGNTAEPTAAQKRVIKATSLACSFVIVSLFLLFAGGAATAVIMALVALYRLL